jgi:dTDP-4-dehydrorhamnose reductase
VDASDAPSVLIVGNGLIGSAVRDLLRAQGVAVASIGRRPADLPAYHALDLATASGRDGLRARLTAPRPACVLLVHGPSDVTRIDAYEAAAAAVHHGVTEIAAGSGLPVVLVSTDNVFPGTRGGYRPDDPAQPTNGYGRVKVLAEESVLGAAERDPEPRMNLVLRVSLVYGWADVGLRATFAQRCLKAAAAGRAMSAPTDQVFTPVYIRDVAAVLAAVCRDPGRLTGIHHLAGPTELSRYDFARLAYQLAGVDSNLVIPCLRADTEWACRPEYSCLESMKGFIAETDIEPFAIISTPAEGLAEMVDRWPVGAR